MIVRRMIVTLLSVIAIGCGEISVEKADNSMSASGPVLETTLLLPGKEFGPAFAASESEIYNSLPPMAIDPNKSYTATIVLSKGGEMVFELYPKEAPITVNNFIFLSRDGYYDGVTFHRVIPEFVAQSGDPTGTGFGGTGYNFDNELSPIRLHDAPGVLSMANWGIRDGLGTNSGQFFITLAPITYLDGYEPNGTSKDCTAPRTSCHTVFGKLIGGNSTTSDEPPRDNIGLFRGRGSQISDQGQEQRTLVEEIGVFSMAVLNNISSRDPSHATSPGDAILTIMIEERD